MKFKEMKKLHPLINHKSNHLGAGQVRDCIKNQVLYQINKGEKIAQIMLCEHKSYFMGYESETERIGGFGSSGN
jgi:hypothetical protein